MVRRVFVMQRIAASFAYLDRREAALDAAAAEIAKREISPGRFTNIDAGISGSQGGAAAARPVHARKVAGSSPAPATKTTVGEGVAPAVASPERDITSRPAPAALPQSERVDLSRICSRMDGMYRQAQATQRASVAPAEGKVSCKCYPEGLVPEWFGADCIEPRCPLKGSAAA